MVTDQLALLTSHIRRVPDSIDADSRKATVTELLICRLAEMSVE